MGGDASYFIGIDVGTGSARASLVAQNGEIEPSSTKDTITWRDQHDHRIFEQSTNNIWEQICIVVKEILKQSNVPATTVKGLRFDATCSLAVSNFDAKPTIVTKGNDIGKDGDRNIILWTDHRAGKEAELINSTGSIVVNYVGRTMSLEMAVIPHIDRYPNGTVLQDAAFRGWWMNEGGQSSTGQLIDFDITIHTAYPELKVIIV